MRRMTIKVIIVNLQSLRDRYHRFILVNMYHTPLQSQLRIPLFQDIYISSLLNDNTVNHIIIIV